MKRVKIKLLVIPGLFPKNEEDIKGIFVIDYLKTVEKFCDIIVLDLYLSTDFDGIYRKNLFGFDVISICVKQNKISKIYSYLRLILRTKRYVFTLANNFDLIHSHGSIIHGNIAYYLSKSLNVPYLISEHTGPFSKVSGKYIFRKMAKQAIENAAALLPVSMDLENQILQSGIKPAKSNVVYNPVDTDLFKPRDGLTFNKNFIFVGRLEDYKGALKSLIAFNNISDDFPEWTLTIVGDGPEADTIKKYINHNPKLKSRVILKGKLCKPSIAAELQKASFFVYPSEHETFGIVIAEAMSCGLPVIVGNRTAPKEYVDEECGRLIDPDSITQISEAIVYMINNHDKYSHQKIRQKIESKFGFNSFGDRLHSVYTDTINAQNSGDNI